MNFNWNSKTEKVGNCITFLTFTRNEKSNEIIIKIYLSFYYTVCLMIKVTLDISAEWFFSGVNILEGQ